MRASWSRKFSYALLGAGLALGCPLGLLVIEAAFRGQWPTLQFIGDELRALPIVYAYTTAFLLLHLTALGFIIGQREDRLRAGSLTDPLTGLWNRRQLDTRLHEEVARASRHHTPLSFLLIDVDQLKQLNDRTGHQAGDEALRGVAEAIRRSCRRSDVAARYGGDEFALLAPSTAGADAGALAERICAAVREEGITSVSIGVADLGDVLALCAPDELYSAADRALYLAKARGRDQVARASDLTPPTLELSRLRASAEAAHPESR